MKMIKSLAGVLILVVCTLPVTGVAQADDASQVREEQAYTLGTAAYAWGFTMIQNEIEVDEDLPNFFRSVKLSDADWVVMENKHLRENYGFNFVP